MPGVSIVIPTWNGLDLLKRFLPAVIESATLYTTQFNHPTEILIVDDGGVDGTAAWLCGQGFTEVSERASEAESSSDQPETRRRLIRNETNLGFGEACNRGFAAASYPLVFLLNNDVEVDVGAIAPLVENFEDASVFSAHCRVFDLTSGALCGTGKLGRFARGFIRVHKSYVPNDSNAGGKGTDPPLYSMFAGGGSAMFNREKFLEIGGFEPLLSPFYWEDVELSYRAWKRGYTILYEPRSVTRHRISSTIGKLDPRAVRRIEQRNRLIYHWIHLHEPTLIASHVLWVLLLAATAPLRFKPAFIASCVAALKLLPTIRKRRLKEKLAARRSDREVFDVFAVLEKRTDLCAYDDYSELESKAPGSSQ